MATSVVGAGGVVRWTPAIGALAVMMATVAGCHGSSARPMSVTPRAETFEWVANLPRQELRGLFAVLGDTIVLTSPDFECRPAPRKPNRETLVYECLNVGAFRSVLIALDRRDPVQASRWSGVATEEVERRVCGPGSSGVGPSACVRPRVERSELDVVHTGRVAVHAYHRS